MPINKTSATVNSDCCTFKLDQKDIKTCPKTKT